MLARVLLVTALLLLYGCSPHGPSVSIDGSSTVFPIVNVMAEDFGDAHPRVRIVANKSGTGSGMQKFARGEIDIATASRPIEPKEVEALAAAKVEFVEIPLAYDGVTVIVHPSNPITRLSHEQLRSAWQLNPSINDWAALGGHPGKIAFYGPTDNHGTYEVFTEAINGKKGNIRRDVQANQDFNVVVQSVAGDPKGMGYVGLDYYLENLDKVKAVAVDGVKPTPESIADGSYAPLSRPLFLYVSKGAMNRPEIREFVDYALGTGGRSAVMEAKYVPLTKLALSAVRTHVAKGRTGTLFSAARPGASVVSVLEGGR
jgi:phosphate transport system substrate-binding protein